MSISVPNISKLYLQFNQMFEAARWDNPKELPKYLDTLCSLQTKIEMQAKEKTASLPEKITSAEQLSKELSAKIDMLFNKDVKGKPPSGPSSGSLSSPVLNCVGFLNRSANCWVIALIQFFLNRPDLLQAWNAVADYYADGSHVDMPHIDAVVAHFHEGPVSAQRLLAGEGLFAKISAPYQRLVALDKLIKDGRTAVAERLLGHLSTAHRDALNNLTKQKPFAEAVAQLLQSQKATEDQRLALLRQAGKNLRDAITICNQTIAAAQQSGQAPRPLAQDVAQNVRVAFNTLFGTVNLATGATVFSANASAQEDAHEAMQVLMGRYQQISQAQGHPPANYSLVETRRIYEPTTDAPEPINPNFPRDALENGTTSRTTDQDYQLIPQLSQVQDQPLETLLVNGYFRVPAAPGTNPAYYQSANNPFLQQKYRLAEERRCFIGDAPQTCTIVIKRFGMTLMGVPYKIQTRVMANRVITMPASAMQANDRDRAYELRSFVSHDGVAGGGHYISYKKLADGSWVGCNDSNVRRMSDAQIDMILHGSTPYILDYRLVPAAQQQAMLAVAAQLRARPAPPQPPTLGSKELVLHKQIIDQLIKLQHLLHKTDATNKQIMDVLQSLHMLSRICLPLLFKITAMHHGKTQESDGQELLYTDPKQLSLIKTSWIRNSSEDILGQLIRSEQEKYMIRKIGEDLNTLKTAASKSGATKDQQEAVKKQELLFNQLVVKYNVENLRAFHALLKNKTVGNEQLKKMLQQEMDIPEEWTNHIYAAIEKMTGKPNGKAQFEANPRILCDQDLLEKFISSLK